MAKQIEYVAVASVLKRCEGGPGAGDRAQILKRAGIRAKVGESRYVGQEELLVEKGKLGAARKALRKVGYKPFGPIYWA